MTRTDPSTATSSDRSMLRGAAIIVTAGVVLSLGVFAIRVAHKSDAWQYLFWRALGFTFAVTVISVVRMRANPLILMARMSRYGLLIALFMTASQIAFISAMKMTTVAETFILCALAPLMAAAAAWPLLGERITPAVLLAIALGLAGVVIMSGGLPEGGSWTGRILALTAAAVFAGYTLAQRLASVADINGALIAVGLFTACASLIAIKANGLPLAVDMREAAIAVVHGALILAIGLTLFGIGSRHVSGVAFTLLAQVETVLGPVWGTLYFREPLTPAMIIGGLLIITGVVTQTIYGPRPQVAT